MPNTMRDKYDEVAQTIRNEYDSNDIGGIAAYLRSAFPPPAEDARQCAVRVFNLAVQGCPEDHWLHKFDSEASAEIESFAQSRVEPWREALESFEAWWRLPNIARSVETIEPAMRKCLTLLSDSPAKEAVN